MQCFIHASIEEHLNNLLSFGRDKKNLNQSSEETNHFAIMTKTWILINRKWLLKLFWCA